MDYNIIVIGSGPGGYHAALRAAQLGQKVACIEEANVGGVCLNIGCIPTKALLHAAQVLREGQHGKEFGIEFSQVNINLTALNGWKDGIVKRLTGGVQSLFKGNKVDLIKEPCHGGGKP
ncbi:MAG: FAD-dependent oxidoreductase [Deinococcales bacterium]